MVSASTILLVSVVSYSFPTLDNSNIGLGILVIARSTFPGLGMGMHWACFPLGELVPYVRSLSNRLVIIPEWLSLSGHSSCPTPCLAQSPSHAFRSVWGSLDTCSVLDLSPLPLVAHEESRLSLGQRELPWCKRPSLAGPGTFPGMYTYRVWVAAGALPSYYLQP